MQLNNKLKLLQYGVLLCAALLPWNATAVNTKSIEKTRSLQFAGRDAVESLLVKSLVQITQGNTRQAMNTINTLIKKAPNFKLAHLIRGDLLSAQSHTLKQFGDLESNANKQRSEAIKGLRDEARTRINHYFSKDTQRLVPNLPVQMNASQKHLIMIDTVKSRLFLYKKSDSGLKYQADYYVTIGKNGADKKIEGDKRTPVGVYFANKKITSPLSEFYGDGAYPINYPNALDLNQNKTGSGIWLHGTPKDTYSRPPKASDGCVVLSNPDIKALSPILKDGNTPVIISDNVEWIDNSKAKSNKAQVKALNKELEQWRKDWVSQDTNQYLKHYSKNFFYSKGKLPEWAAHKTRVQSNKPKVRIEVNNVSIFGYPNVSSIKRSKNTHPIVVVDFDQFYQSPTLKNKMRKRQYWQYENKTWKIIYEGTA